MWLHRRSFESGLRTIHRAAVPVVSVGNLQAGGTGKTPLTGWLRRALESRGLSPWIVLRGYGGSGAAQVVTQQSEVREVGDEALEHVRAGTQVVVGRDRYSAIQKFVPVTPAAMVLLDDGFQHRKIARDADIVVWRTDPQGRLDLLPSGVLREPLAQIGRATHLAVHGDPAALPPALRDAGLPMLAFRYAPLSFQSPGGERIDPKAMAAGRYTAIAAIGQTAPFFASVTKAMGSPPVWARAFDDHYAWTKTEAEALVRQARADGARWLVMTQKDATRWPLPQADDRVQVAIAATQFVPTDEAAALQWVESIVRRLPDPARHA